MLSIDNVYIKLFDKAIKRNEIFEFLIGKGEYEIRCQHAEMPTDTVDVSYTIIDYLTYYPSFDISQLIQGFIKLSEGEKWCWLIVYYMIDFKENGKYDIPYNKLYHNLTKHKESLKNNYNWISSNENYEKSIWQIIVELNTYSQEKEKLDLPNLE